MRPGRWRRSTHLVIGLVVLVLVAAVVGVAAVETELLLHEMRGRLGGSMTRVAVEDLDTIGSLHGWKPARSIVQWSVEKAVSQGDSETDS